MPKSDRELENIMAALDRLQSRVRAPSSDPTADPGANPATAGNATTATATLPEPAAGSEAYQMNALETQALVLVRAGIVDLTGLRKVKEFPIFFGRLAARLGLRMLLVKRWASGLQVLMEEGVSLPAEVKKRRSDGRAPIPSNKDDLFAAIGQEAAVYSGPVPIKHFPLDLTLMLGRGSRERRIVILPLPARDQWNSFVYIDADKTGEDSLAVIETLAQFALTSLKLLNSGDQVRQGKLAGILREEMYRRRRSSAYRKGSGPDGDGSPEALADPVRENDAKGGPGASDKVDPDAQLSDGIGDDLQGVDPTRDGVPQDGIETSSGGGQTAVRSRAQAAREQAEEIVRKWEEAVLNHRGSETDGRAGTDSADTTEAAADEIVGRFVRPGQELAPADILHASGELPALPKAACHIMAVIEDPRTTATKLEKAIALDQALTAKVLRVANSPFYGAVREIKTVSEAIVRLGYVTIRNWSLVTATKSAFLSPGSGLLYQKIWRQSVMSAMATQLVAQALRLRDSESLFVGGLMQNIGQLVLARSQPELFLHVLEVSGSRGRPYHEVERQVLGFDHGALGALLIKEWNLSEDLEEAVRWHHRFDEPEAKNVRVAAMIALGEEIAACTGAEPDEDDLRHETSTAAAHLNVDDAVYRKLIDQARNLSIDPSFFS